MKTTKKHLPFYIFLLVLVWKSSLVQAQSQSDITYTGDIFVGTQAGVNLLDTILAGKTIIDGYVHIQRLIERGGITDLTPLSSIVRITGNFNVFNNDSLTDLGNFPVLQSIGGNFNVFNNIKLTDVGDFPVLQSIGGYFNVRDNSELTDVGDFPVLQTIGEYFSLWNNRKLTDVGDFPVLQTIGEYFRVDAYSLTDLGNFPVLQTIGEYFSVSSYSLTDLGNFPVLQTIGGGFVVNNNRKLTDVGDFPNLTSIGVATLHVFSEGWEIDSVSIVVENNPGLSDCSVLTDFLSGGTHAVSGEIFINDNAVGCNSGDEIMAPAPVDTIISSLVQTQIGDTYTGSIFVRTQAQVNEMNTFLSGKTIIDGDVIIGGNDIIDLTPLDSIVRITGAFEVRSNRKLTDVGTFPVLKTIGGAFWVHHNDSLTDLGNFPALQSIGYYFYVWNNDKLTDLGNFPALQAIGNAFDVHDNDILTSLGEFPALQSIGGAFYGGTFYVTDNRKLTDLGDFPNLTSIGFASAYVLSSDEPVDSVSILVERNPNLVLCSWLEDFFSVGMHAVSGKIFISDNGAGCNSGNEILASIHKKESLFILYPNPTKGALNIEGVTGYLQMYIYDLVGTEVMTYSLTSSKKTIDVSDLPSGIYVVTLRGKGKTWTEVLKIVN